MRKKLSKEELAEFNVRSIYTMLIPYRSQIDGYIEMYPDDHEGYEYKKRCHYLINNWFYEHDCRYSDAIVEKFDSNDSEIQQFKSDMIELIEELNEFLKK